MIFFQSALICPILTHFENFFFFSKCVDLVPNLTHFEIFFQSAQFFKVRCNNGMLQDVKPRYGNLSKALHVGTVNTHILINLITFTPQGPQTLLLT